MSRWQLLLPVVVLVACGSAGRGAVAQAVAPGSEQLTPRENVPALPAPEFLPQQRPGFALPPPPAPRQPGLASGPSILVKDIVLDGNTVLPAADLDALVEPYQGREVTLEELFRLKDEITLAYVNAGYVNSGATLPDQDVTEGTVRFQIVEGGLEAVEITGTEQLSAPFLEERIRLGAGPPLNVNALQDRLQLLLQDPAIRKLDARLLPGSQPGQARLAVAVEEEPKRFSVVARAANDQSPSIGANDAGLTFTWFNLFGRNDPLVLTGDVTEGLQEASFYYSVPLTARDLRFHIGGQISNADVVNDDVEDLNIESSAKQITVGFGMPVIDTTANRVGLDLSFNRERNRTYLLNEPFSFSPGTDDGKSDVSVLQFTQDWQNRGRSRALSVASTFNFGLPILGATDNGCCEQPSGDFFYWFGQGQLAHRLFSDRDQVVLRGQAQLATDALLASQQYSLGGIDTVRGYFVNEVVRDSGFAVGLEYRYPILDLWDRERIRGPDDMSLELVPFLDYGYAVNHHGNPEDVDSDTLASAGLGLRWIWPPRVLAEVYWGNRFSNRDGDPDDFLLDNGINFRVSVQLY